MNKDHICLFPFYAFYYRGDDFKIGSCCLQKPMLSTIKDGDVKSWWTSIDAQKIRQQFLDGKWPESCKICQQQEVKGNTSFRQRWTEQFMLRIGASYDDLDVVKGNSNGSPIFIDYKPDNFCNLSCSMCNPGSSSQVEKMAKETGIDYWSLRNEDSFLHNDQIKSLVDENTRRIKLNGGEPTINEKIKDIYQYVINKGYAKNIELQFTTNFTNVNKTFDMLKHFKSVSVGASLDGTGPTYEYIRTPAKWKQIKQNILKYKKLLETDTNKYKFGVNSVWYSATAFTINDWVPELLDFMQEHFPKRFIMINQCQTPYFQNLSIIPNEYRQEIYENINKLEKQYTEYSYIFKDMRFGLDNFSFESKNLQTWQHLNPKMDAYKKISILNLHPRFRDLLNYNV